jgi:hypothetical protein
MWTTGFSRIGQRMRCGEYADKADGRLRCPQRIRQRHRSSIRARWNSPRKSEPMTLATARPSRWSILLMVAAAACALSRTPPSPELAGTSSPTGCDAWFEIGGTFSRVNDVRYTLQNRSTGPQCPATRVVVLFSGQLRSAAFRVSTPAGWRRRDVPCETGGGVCGFEWRTRHGVLPGAELPGFGLVYDPAEAPLPRSWIVDVGRRRVEMPIGTAGG